MSALPEHLVGAWQHATRALAEVMRIRISRQHARRGGPQLLEQDEGEAVNLVRMQVREIRVLSEEITSRWRDMRNHLTRLCDRLQYQEQDVAAKILTALSEIDELLDATYGRSQAA